MLCCAVLCCEHAFICYCALPAYVRLCVCMHACYHLRTSRIQPSAPVILRTTREQGRRYTQARPAVLCSLSCVSEEQQQQPPRGGVPRLGTTITGKPCATHSASSINAEQTATRTSQRKGGTGCRRILRLCGSTSRLPATVIFGLARSLSPTQHHHQRDRFASFETTLDREGGVHVPPGE